MPRRKTQQDVITGFRGVLGDYYDYSSVAYVNSQTKVKVGCPVHGVFEITPGYHSKGVGCRNCYFSSQKTSKSEFVSRVQKYFGDRYDYSLFNDLPKAVRKCLFCAAIMTRFSGRSPTITCEVTPDARSANRSSWLALGLRGAQSSP
jgi:hypothetical protein